MADHRTVHTVNAPQAIGPYSQAVLAGDTLYVSGQLGMDPTAGKLVEGGTVAQAEQALKNVQAILTQAGFTMHDVVQVQVFLADMGDFKAMNEVYAKFFSEPYPARAAIEAAALPAGGKVEILAVAKK